MVKEKSQPGCWSWFIHENKKRFPTFAFLLLLVSVVWMLSEMRIITVRIPIWPVIFIAVSLWMIINFYSKK